MKKSKFILYGFLFVYIMTTNCFATTSNNLVDIHKHWAESDINYLYENEIINGYEDNTFRPNQTIRLAEFLKILIQISNCDLTVGENLWPDSYMMTAIKNNWIQGENLENANKIINRYDTIKILSNYIGLDDLKKSKNIFKDLNKEHKEEVLKLLNLNIINGYEDNTFRGEKEVTRAEACKMIKKAYNVKQDLIKNRRYELTSKITNIDKASKESLIKNRYEIKNNRIYIYDEGRYANLNAQTLNQEYINDKKIIDILKVLVDEESYTELKFVPDKYIINSLNIVYGEKESSVLNGGNSFQIRFYENSYYNVADSKDEETFIKEAMIKIKLGKMWEQLSEKNTEICASDKNLYKLEAVLGVIFSEDYKEKIMEYIIEKRIEAGKLANTDEPKIVDVRNFGKYTLNIWCVQNQELEIYIQKF